MSGSQIAFVQETNSDPGTSGVTTVSAAFASAQNRGDLVVVTIGWTSQVSNTETISSITDTSGNTYTAAGAIVRHAGNFDAPAVGASLVMYYAKNIKAASAGANTLQVTLSSSVNFPVLIAAEYSGADTVNPLLAGTLISSTGNSTSASPGTSTAHVQTCVWVAGEYQDRACTGVSAPFTSRVITTNDDVCLADNILNGTANGASVTPTFTLTTGTNEGWLAIAAAFQAPLKDVIAFGADF